MIVGITGGIGSGKSTVTSIFQEFGYSVVDADKISKNSLDYGTETYKKIVRRFGDHILYEDRRINRSYLAQIVFSNPEKLSDLNKITHEAVREQALQEISELKDKGITRIAYDCPLPVEKGFLDLVDYVTVVLAPLDRRFTFIKKRNPHMTDQMIQERMKNQLSDEEYLSIADYVVDNSGSMEELRCRVKAVISKIEECEI
ncbi:MAG TPA: dephospho-CoA kinase [Clostridiales bacterium]|nr:dephospho-CoA kinase [Clostridiales bacterium]